MRGEASAVFGGLIGVIAHFLVLYGVAPAIGYEADPFVNIAGITGALAAFSIYLLVLGLLYPLAYHYSLAFLPEGGVLAGGFINAVPVWLGFVVLDCLNTDQVAMCAAVAGVAALAYGYLLTYSHVEFASDF
ncbi:DUF6789 family protein [Salarchaeum sp. III]|uniref:DUF6789 family protein n=1 Tax=Salarchaeum sp. III TaxID=3107927 RepID=UPI002ED83BDD